MKLVLLGKEIPQSPLAPSTMWGHSESLGPGRRLPLSPAGILILDFQAQAEK